MCRERVAHNGVFWPLRSLSQSLPILPMTPTMSPYPAIAFAVTIWAIQVEGSLGGFHMGVGIQNLGQGFVVEVSQVKSDVTEFD